MDLFKRKKKAIEPEEEMDSEMRDEQTNEEIPFTDRRRININAETASGDQPKAEKMKSADVLRLEKELTDERTRREAAESKLVGVQAKFEEVKNNLEKETAEMRDRMRKSLEDRALQGQFNFLTTLLPVLDNLNLAIKAAENETVSEGLFAGIRGTASGFESALQTVGVESVPSVGTPFNPEIHEAVDMIEADADGIITAEYSRGYKFGERLLRPARVQVGRAAASAAAE